MNSGHTLLLKGATVVATMDDARREIADGAVYMRGHAIEAVGPAQELPAVADEVIDCRGMVVLTDAYYPGWKAQVDGRGTAIHEAYGFVRGVVVEGGEHAVEFVYRPASVMMGALLSLGSALAALGCALHLRLH